MDKTAITNEFIDFCKDFLGIRTPVKIVLTTDREKYNIETTAYYAPDYYFVCVYIKGRLLVDIFRSLAHELTHHKQFEEGRLNNIEEDGSDGSNIENEANAKAGEIIRKFGKIRPEIYKN